VTLVPDPAWPEGWIETAGFWPAGELAVRMDVAERLARALHARRPGRASFQPDPRWAAMLGLDEERFAQVMRALGYRPAAGPDAAAGAFAWAGTGPQRRAPRPRPAPHSPFLILSTIGGGVA
jgi:ATP-dependent RNA helicase SUPV3L1/SUV3